MNADGMTDLINRIRAGDHDAMSEFVARYGVELRAVIRSFLNSGNKLQRVLAPSDILQSVLLLLSRDTGPSKESVQNGNAYIYRLISNRLIHQARKFTTQRRDLKQVHDGEGLLGGVADPSPSPDLVLVQKDILERLMNSLTADEQQIAHDRIAGRTWEEIAFASGDNSNTVQRRFYRTLERLREPLLDMYQ